MIYKRNMRGRYAITLIFFTLFYFLIGKFGLSFASFHPSASAIWPPTGIALSGVLLWGSKLWPAILLGSYLVNVTTAGSASTSVGIAIGNTLEALIASYLVKRFARGVYAFERPRHIFTFSLVAGVIATAISAIIGTTTLASFRFVPWSEYFVVWRTWWLGDMGGALIVAPVIILWTLKPHATLSRDKIIEFVGVCVALIGASWFVFSGRFPFPYLIAPVILWSAFRFRPRETATLVLILAGFAVRATLLGLGPFFAVAENTNDALGLLQTFLSITAMANLAVSAAVSERKKAEENISLKEKHFRALIQKSSDAISLVDAKGKILYVSPSTTRILGYRPEEIVGSVGFPLVHPDDLPRVQKLLASIAQTPNTSETIEIRVKHRDGRYIWIESTTTNLLTDPSVGALVANYRNISERKELEQAKNQFFSIAAHELRSPLSAIRWELELLRRKKIPRAIQKDFNHIYESTLRMVTLTNELLNVTRIIEGEIPDKPVESNLIENIGQEVEQLKGLAKKQSVSIIFTHRIAALPYVIDPKLFNAIIHNLLTNAIQYGTKGGVVSVATALDPRGIHITVADNGIGIPETEKGKIFEKFFRAPNAIAVRAEGTGLGLFIVKSYVDHLHGRIWFESPTKENKGTTFHIVLPAHGGRKGRS